MSKDNMRLVEDTYLISKVMDFTVALISDWVEWDIDIEPKYAAEYKAEIFEQYMRCNGLIDVYRQKEKEEQQRQVDHREWKKAVVEMNQLSLRDWMNQSYNSSEEDEYPIRLTRKDFHSLLVLSRKLVEWREASLKLSGKRQLKRIGDPAGLQCEDLDGN